MLAILLLTIHHSPLTIHHSPFTIHHSPVQRNRTNWTSPAHPALHDTCRTRIRLKPFLVESFEHYHRLFRNNEDVVMVWTLLQPPQW